MRLPYPYHTKPAAAPAGVSSLLLTVQCRATEKGRVATKKNAPWLGGLGAFRAMGEQGDDSGRHCQEEFLGGTVKSDWCNARSVPERH